MNSAKRRHTERAARAARWAAAAGLLLGGCGLWDGSLYDTYTPPEELLGRIEPVSLSELAAKTPEREAPTPSVSPAELKLSIETCRRSALERNLDLRVQLFNPAIARESAAEADAAFEPYLFGTLGFVRSESPVLQEAIDAPKSEMYAVDGGLKIPLRTGGEITVTQPFTRAETNNPFTKYSTSYSADLSLAITQPLLRGGGVRTATHGLRLARYGVGAARARTRLEVIRVLAAADRVYWRLYAARQELLVRKQEYDLAIAQRDSAVRKVDLKEAERIEIDRAEEAAAQRLQNIIVADNAVRDRERELKVILNRADVGLESPTVLVPETEPAPVRYVIDRERAVAYALAHRMELVELELALAGDESSVEYARNGRLPILSASYTYNINALGTTAHDAYDMMLDNKYVDHRVGLYIQIPLGNEAAASRLRQAVARREQRLATREQRRQAITQETLAAADQLEANWQRVVASRKGTALARRTLEAEKNRFENGLQTSIEVLNAQARYANAQSAEIAALVEYQIAQVDLAYATGSILGAANILWDEGENRLRAE
ncbi:MAG TPA: TolC family protein [Planctomycetota bacterium]|jgi:outer membrane protein TolC|nr:TolC family protein [Planctomycetota bacterium]OQC21890.1 MAG: outer membrane channel protein [Planctomycetes bacterium ADurb.Bin069]HOE29575.1 TolC family protein [Planctomycetota bacterium]HOE86220.1 TolC family protein [Planctomycetota bacterium]HOR67116.1 TolC family protein [Planctomycetota bacterium]